jgi:hypothetical protein|tara:strand:- start:963 stop:1505 length:543 start_codon:yes stop_codon:yes gene_type:complete
MYGKVATTVKSKKLDTMVKTFRDNLKHEFNGFTVQNKLTENNFADFLGYKPLDKGCEPDGGIWFYNGLPVLVIEAKHEDKGGNAHQRWWENANIISICNPKCIYYTFATGIGCRKKWVDMQYMSYEAFNKRNLLDTRWSLNENGFTEQEVKETFISLLNEILGKNNKPFQYPQPRGKLYD